MLARERAETRPRLLVGAERPLVVVLRVAATPSATARTSATSAARCSGSFSSASTQLSEPS